MRTLAIATLIIFVSASRLACAYDLNVDLAHGLIGPRLTGYAALIGDNSLFSEYPEDCAAIYLKQQSVHQLPPPTGIYEIWPRQGKPIKVLCDMDTDGGGWTVFQKRGDFTPQEDFYRTWLEYKRGFGDLQRQFWLGNDRLSLLTNQDSYQLRVDLEDFDAQKRFAQYSSFRVSSEADKYRLTLGSYVKGDAGDSLSTENNMQFSTKDQDNDLNAVFCAQIYNGAWWYRTCHSANLNGGYLRGNHPTVYAAGVNWFTFRGYYYSLKATEMKIRPVWFKP
ncbi:unnamed protein product [Rotaria magnacalcarata]|uniref:Fibrinogen C-terminal domain-containing protein n=1 Tax=Rotaria magnacalcarata TaxID=392030 RepID=A0A816U960_9BILA|nr:unnamed protein product [Rotaria magnacalcarata]CAF1536076.1 unnamed protein product [Rotaria magnacalcarata]CAF2105490.1 unnamed protein product [Rotaria magnacalcarata]CAF2116178.1 unnamed protein product [Rotaria magnacalcarata]CAF2173433.1 unnamed protein product [Rotaria magnacalcarata]